MVASNDDLMIMAVSVQTPGQVPTSEMSEEPYLRSARLCETGEVSFLPSIHLKGGWSSRKWLFKLNICCYACRADGDTNTYCIEFIYDSEVDCQFTVYRSLPDTTTLESLCSGRSV